MSMNDQVNKLFQHFLSKFPNAVELLNEQDFGFSDGKDGEEELFSHFLNRERFMTLQGSVSMVVYNKKMGRETPLGSMSDLMTQMIQCYYFLEDLSLLILENKFSWSRFPYTYHHDEIRNCFSEMSRSDVASMSSDTPILLIYGTAFYHIIKNLDFDTIIDLMVIQSIPQSLARAKKFRLLELDRIKQTT